MDKIVKYTTNSTSVVVIASDGTGYATIAALLAAGKKCYPGLDAGMDLSNLTVYTEDGAGGDGDPVYYTTNQTTAPTTATMRMVSGGGQKFTVEGVNRKNLIPIRNVWISKTTGTDYAVLAGDA